MAEVREDFLLTSGLTKLLGAGAVLALIAGIVLDQADRGFRSYFSTHQFTASVIVALLVLIGTVALLNRMTTVREARQWEEIAGEPIQAVRWWLVSTHIWMERAARFTIRARSHEHALPADDPIVLGHEAKRDEALQGRENALQELHAALDTLKPVAFAHSSLAARYKSASDYLRIARQVITADVHTPEYWEGDEGDKALRRAWKAAVHVWGWRLDTLWTRAYLGVGYIDFEEGIW